MQDLRDYDLERAYPRIRRGLTITCENPEPPKVITRELLMSRRLAPAMTVIAKFREWHEPRVIPPEADVVLVKPGQKPVATHLMLPPTGGEPAMVMPGQQPELQNGKSLKIISLTPRVTVILPFTGGLINGRAESLHLDGVGASAELYADSGTWILIAAHNAELKAQPQPNERKAS